MHRSSRFPCPSCCFKQFDFKHSCVHSAIVYSALKGTCNKQSSFRLKTSSTASTSTPIDRLWKWKLENIETVPMEWQNATAQNENFKQELSQAVLPNTGTLSVCGKCHLKLGYIRQNCVGEDWTSVTLWGILDIDIRKKNQWDEA